MKKYKDPRFIKTQILAFGLGLIFLIIDFKAGAISVSVKSITATDFLEFIVSILVVNVLSAILEIENHFALIQNRLGAVETGVEGIYNLYDEFARGIIGYGDKVTHRFLEYEKRKGVILNRFEGGKANQRNILFKKN